MYSSYPNEQKESYEPQRLMLDLMWGGGCVLPTLLTRLFQLQASCHIDQPEQNAQFWQWQTNIPLINHSSIQVTNGTSIFSPPKPQRFRSKQLLRPEAFDHLGQAFAAHPLGQGPAQQQLQPNQLARAVRRKPWSTLLVTVRDPVVWCCCMLLYVVVCCCCFLSFFDVFGGFCMILEGFGTSFPLLHKSTNVSKTFSFSCHMLRSASRDIPAGSRSAKSSWRDRRRTAATNATTWTTLPSAARSGKCEGSASAASEVSMEMSATPPCHNTQAGLSIGSPFCYDLQ